MPRRGIAAASTRLALRLAGLQVHHRLRAGSPGKAFTPQPGECAAVSTRLALRLAGLRFITVCGPVARVRRLR
ncbi:hypothetical protein, partial [Klebsiella michiganensis]